jgi:hypothetical protein
VVDLVAEGEGVYRLDPVRLTIAGPTGQRWIPLLSDDSSIPGPYSYIPLVVWPDGDRDLFGAGPATGWTWRTEGKATLDPAATAVIYQGRHALAVQASGVWKAFCETSPPVSRVGYDSLRLSVHPGEGAAPPALTVGLNANKRRDLLKLVNWADKRWQQAAIPLDSLLEPFEAAGSMVLSGSMKGTFHVDEVRLVAAAPPAPPPVTVVQEAYSPALPQTFSLGQNYPNPFNSETVISFALPARGDMDLALFNLAGQKVCVLARGAREAGSYVLRWDGRDDTGRALASGVYLYRLQVAGHAEARKLLLLR